MDALVVHVDANPWSYANTTLLWAGTGKLVRSFHYGLGVAKKIYWHSLADLVAFLREVAMAGAKEDPVMYAPVCALPPFSPLQTLHDGDLFLPPYAEDTVSAFEEVNNLTVPPELKTLLVTKSRQVSRGWWLKLCEFRAGLGVGPDEVDVFYHVERRFRDRDESGEVEAAMALGWPTKDLAREVASLKLNGGTDSGRRLVRVDPSCVWTPTDDLKTFEEALTSDAIDPDYLDGVDVAEELQYRSESRRRMREALQQASVRLELPSWPPSHWEHVSDDNEFDKTGLLGFSSRWSYVDPQLVLRGPYAGCIRATMSVFSLAPQTSILFPDVQAFLVCQDIVKRLS